MNRKEKLEAYLYKQLESFSGIGLAIFISFFVCECVEIQRIRSDNDKLTNAILEHTESLDDNYDVLITNLLEVSNYKRSLKTMIDIAYPYICMIESYRNERGDIVEFLSQIKEQNDNHIEIFDRISFDEIILTAKISEMYPKIKPYLLAKAKNRLVLQLAIYSGSSSCFIASRKPFTIYKKVGDQHHFYPNNFAVLEGRSYYRINGKICRGEYHWKPKRKGMHYFDIEYINVEGMDVFKKKFKIGVKVV